MKRHALKLLLFLLALLVGGAIINVAVAWGCVLAPPLRESTPRPLFESELVRHLGWNGGDTWDGWTNSSIGKTSIHIFDGRVKSLPGVINDPDLFIQVTQCGWPCHTLQQREEGTVFKLINLNQGPRAAFDALPKQCMPTGFAINTIFYAIILCMLFTAPFAIRRRRRIKRGQCAACGYSLRENTSENCPECGSSTPSPAKRERVGVRAR